MMDYGMMRRVNGECEAKEAMSTKLGEGDGGKRNINKTTTTRVLVSSTEPGGGEGGNNRSVSSKLEV